jgi:formylglycine-generating enzyme required for sulfatase activity
MRSRCWLGWIFRLKQEEEASETEFVPQPEPEPEFIEPLDMVDIHGGTFLMGSPDSDEVTEDREKPQHDVRVSDFCISRYLITRQLYRELVEASPEQWANETDDQQLPANFVNWFEAVQFCNALSEQNGLQSCYRFEGEQQVEWDSKADGYRLPTEAEWEYACRAETTSKWFCGDDSAELSRFAWFDENADNQVHAVGQKEPNPWGLYDMSGNVYEWCWDWFEDYAGETAETESDPIGPQKGKFRVLRGGSFGFVAWVLRSAFRRRLYPVNRNENDGFRCVRRPRRQP